MLAVKVAASYFHIGGERDDGGVQDHKVLMPVTAVPSPSAF